MVLLTVKGALPCSHELIYKHARILLHLPLIEVEGRSVIGLQWGVIAILLDPRNS